MLHLRDQTSVAEDLRRALRTQLAESARISWPSQRYADDPAGFCRDILGIWLWDMQTQIMSAIAGHDRVAMCSGRKCGKTTMMAAMALWWVCTWDRAAVYMIAPDTKLLEDVLWREILNLHARSGRCYDCAQLRPAPPVPCPHSARVGGRIAVRSATGWTSADGLRSIRQMSMDPSTPEAAAGRSGGRQLYLADEATGISEQLMQAIVGNCMGGGKIVMASNPTESSGMFFEAMAGKLQNTWKTFEVSCLDTPNYLERRVVIPGLCDFHNIERNREDWGEKSREWQVQVLGKFVVGEEGRIISQKIIEGAIERWGETVPSGRLVIGADVAGDGDSADETVIAIRRGDKLFSVEIVRGGVRALIPAIRGAILTYGRGCGKPLVVFDALGRFGVLAHQLLEVDVRDDSAYDVFAFIGSTRIASRTVPYYTRRDESWARVAQWLGDGGTIPPGEEKLVQELRYAAWERRSDGKSRATPREEIVRGLGRSADRAQAVILSVCVPDQFRPTAAEGPPQQSDAYSARAYEGGAMSPFAGGARRG